MLSRVVQCEGNPHESIPSFFLERESYRISCYPLAKKLLTLFDIDVFNFDVCEDDFPPVFVSKEAMEMKKVLKKAGANKPPPFRPRQTGKYSSYFVDGVGDIDALVKFWRTEYDTTVVGSFAALLANPDMTVPPSPLVVNKGVPSTPLTKPRGGGKEDRKNGGGYLDGIVEEPDQ